MEYNVSLDGYDLVVEITHYSAGYRGVYNALPENCYPDEPDELEFDVIAGIETDEDGTEIEMTKEQLAEVQNEYADLIEQKLWEEIKEEPDYD